MQMKLSRHAKRRANSYRIPEATILQILRETVKELPPGDHEIIQKVEGFEYPIKIVVAVEDDTITVITNYHSIYHLKKGREP